MTSDLEARIRERAYEIWESEGRPQGRSDEHWAQARAEFADARSETGAAPEKPEMQKVSSPKPAAATTSAKPSKSPAKPTATTKPKTTRARSESPESGPDKGVAIATKEVAKSVKKDPVRASAKGAKRSPAARGTKSK